MKKCGQSGPVHPVAETGKMGDRWVDVRRVERVVPVVHERPGRGYVAGRISHRYERWEAVPLTGSRAEVPMSRL